MDLASLLAYSSALFGFALALAVAWIGRRSIAHWSFAFGMGLLAVESIFAGLGADALAARDLASWQNWSLFTMSLLPGFWLCFSLAYARGDHRSTLARWRLPLAATFLLPLGIALLFRSNIVLFINSAETDQTSLLRLGRAGLALNVLFLLTMVLVLMNLERTYRASVGTMRWRIKFMILGLGVLFAARAYTSSQALLFHALKPSLQAVNSGALLLACLLVLRSLSRSGHFEVNVYPSHSVLHNSLTVLLAGVYLLIVGVLAKVVTFLGGDNSFTLKAFLVLLSLVLLTILLLSEKVRLHSKRLVSRHFQRPLYDYRTVWRTFTEGTARCVERTDLCGTAARLISQLFQALSVTIWLVDARRENLAFAASTSISEPEANRLTLDPADAAQVIASMSHHPEPIDIDSSKEVWAVVLRRLHPDEFRKGGNRICVPLAAGGDLLGVLTLGDRVGGAPYSLQDFDLLKSVTNQTAASLLNIQLSQRLAQGKQLEAFQAMSAFFVHDLKNTASTLSLMLENLPLHFNDPAFREDALRGISRTIAHINDLIGRLGLLRKELTIQPIQSDLNQVITDALQAIDALPQVELVRSLQTVPKVPLDPVQIRNVITNLVLNARDAMPSGGQIKINTSQRNGWVVLAVSDNGCGMSPEFVQQSLFRPFQTTKKKGIGIGMFQSRMIVEAHRGRIEVDTEPGKGTSFRVLLPVS
jgi:putative PEP-CTERM system histidine kinase